MSQIEPLSAPSPDAKPYVGPQPFTRDDEPKLFGRGDEIRELLAMITASPITVIYAQSGAGKTSLLNAKILPLLARRPCEILPAAPLAPVRVASPLPVPSKARNIYTFHALASLSPDRKPSSSKTLTEFLAELPKPREEVGIRRPRVLAFDQFEELFTRYPDRWANRADFFEDIAVAIEQDPRLRIVFAMRDEFIASFDAYGSNLPANSVSRFHLQRLRREAAREAIVRPAENAGVSIADRAVKKLLDKLLVVPSAGNRGRFEEFVEPMHLQLVCYNLWRNRGPGTEIGSAAIRVHGDVEKALRDYFDSCLTDILKSARANIRAGTLRSWIEQKFITADGKRAMVYKGSATTEGIPNAIIDELELRYIIRTEPRGDSLWCELAHERFVQPILASNALWRGTADATNRLTALELKAGSWAKYEKDDKYLITGAELKRAQQWLDSEAAAEAGVPKNVEEFVKRSAEIHQERSARSTRLWILLLVLAVVSAGALTLYFLRSSRRERAERYRAQNALALAHQEVAETMLREERPLDALAWSVRAVAVGKLDKTIATLRKSLAATGTTLWLRRATAATTLDLSADARHAVTVSRSEMCVWDLGVGGKVRCESAPPKQIWFAAQFSPGGAFIVATSLLTDDLSTASVSVRRSDGSPVSEMVERALDNGNLLEVCDQKGLIVTLKNKEVVVFDAASGDVLGRRSFNLPVPQADISRDCSHLLVNGFDSSALWDVPTLRGLKALVDRPTESYVVNRVEFDETGKRAVVFWEWGSFEPFYARIYDLGGNLLGTVSDLAEVADARLVRNGTELAVQGGGRVSFFDVKTGAVKETVALARNANIKSDRRFVIEVASTPNGTRIVTYDRNSRTSKVVEIEDQTFDAAVVSDNGSVVMTQKGGNIRIWDSRVPKIDVAGLNTDQLFQAACRQLQKNGYTHIDVTMACIKKRAS